MRFRLRGKIKIYFDLRDKPYSWGRGLLRGTEGVEDTMNSGTSNRWKVFCNFSCSAPVVIMFQNYLYEGAHILAKLQDVRLKIH